jgi:hypothetical protein
VVELGAKLTLVDDVGQAHRGRSVVQGEGDADVPVPLLDKLRHQQLVEIGVQQGADDRVDPVGVVVGALGEIHPVGRP